jgi:hypothetical protein
MPTEYLTMPKVWVSADEWYPVYYVTEERPRYTAIELTAEELEAFTKAMDEADEWQRRIADLVYEADNRKRKGATRHPTE